MSKQFFKIIVIFLLLSTINFAGSFCLESLFKSIINISPVSAASNDNLINDTDTDTCTKDVDKHDSETPITNQASHKNNQSLPCCLDGSHVNSATIVQVFELDKLVPLTFFRPVELLPIISKFFVYHSPIIAPPELLALNTTVLRL